MRAARLEGAVSSIQQVVVTEEDYDRHFSTTNIGAPGAPSGWSIERESSQVPGLGASGGWIDLVYLRRRVS